MYKQVGIMHQEVQWIGFLTGLKPIHFQMLGSSADKKGDVCPAGKKASLEQLLARQAPAITLVQKTLTVCA